MDQIEVLTTQIISQDGCFMRVRRWLKGQHPQLGILTMGWSGWETIVETDVFKPIHTFEVKEFLPN